MKDDYPQFVFYVQQQSLKDEEDGITIEEFGADFCRENGIPVLPNRMIITHYYVDGEGKMLNRHHQEFPLVECDYPKYYKLLREEYKEKFNKIVFSLHVDRIDPYDRVFYVKDGQQIDIPQDSYNALVEMADELRNATETDEEKRSCFRVSSFIY